MTRVAYAAVLPAMQPDSKNAAQVIGAFGQFGAELRPRAQGGSYLVVPAHTNSPLRTARLLKEFCRDSQYQTYRWWMAELSEKGLRFPCVKGGAP